MHQLLSAW